MITLSKNNCKTLTDYINFGALQYMWHFPRKQKQAFFILHQQLFPLKAHTNKHKSEIQISSNGGIHCWGHFKH